MTHRDIQKCCLIRLLCIWRVRMLWSFARDHGGPLHGVWSTLNPLTGTPVNAVWAMAALAFLLGLPILLSLSVFGALLSISSIGLYVSCELTLNSLQIQFLPKLP